MIYFGDIIAQGWLKDEVYKTMEGCIGHLDQLLPGLIMDHKIYGKDRITPDAALVELGRKDCSHHGVVGDDKQFYWWNSETQSNWWDGYCRSALLTGEKEWIEKAKDYIEEMLEYQDPDGYMGIYGPELRFQNEGENGELWAQSTLFRALLGYYEAVKDEKILDAVIRAADRIMDGYPKEVSHPFNVNNSNSGHSHGLTVVDTFHRLYQLTGKEKYVDYAVWLYEDFSSWAVGEEDMQSGNIEDSSYIFRCHGVHTYEHIRGLIIAAKRQEKYQYLLDILLAKLPFYLTPSGGPIGDEWIFGRTADATYTGYEYCSVQELLDSYLILMQASEDLKWGDEAEWLFYNASFGMRHPTESSIMYCMTDNCYEANERKHPDDDAWNPRYKFSPTHQDAAVCCVPNSGRIIPYFVQSIFMECKDGFKAGLYGPCSFTGKYQDVMVKIQELTNYPMSFKVELEVSAERPIEFSLYLRFPRWANQMKVNGRVYTREEAHNGEIKLHKVWGAMERVEIQMDTQIQFHTDFNWDYYVSYGPILYAYPLKAREKLIRQMEVKPFAEKGYLPIEREMEGLKIAEEDKQEFRLAAGEEKTTFKDLYIHGVFRLDGQKIEGDMVPMGETILRKVTFQEMR